MNMRPIADLLNECMKLDPEAVRRLMTWRVECNDALADHPRVIVTADEKKCILNVVGLLNGAVENPDDRLCMKQDAETLDVIGFGIYSDFKGN